MIEISQSPSVLGVREWLAGEDAIEAVKQNLSELSDCKSYNLTRCDCLPVLASLSVTNSEFNDFSSYIYKIGGSETITATLTEQDGTVHTIVDNTYGDFYTTGTLKTSVWGFKLSWNKVANALGFGVYTFKVVIDNVAAVRNAFVDEFCYKLIPFSCDNADSTVRLTTYKNGYIENGFDYRDLSIGDWVDQIRLYGIFKLDEHTETVDNLLLSNRDLHQIQTQIIDTYDLILRQINSSVSTSIIKDSLLANRMYVDDYNRDNVNDYKVKYISFVSIEKPTQAEINGTLYYNIKFTEFNQSTLKRNF